MSWTAAYRNQHVLTLHPPLLLRRVKTWSDQRPEWYASLCPCHRPLAHPYMLSPLLWMVAVVLCFGGGFAGLICAQAYDAHKSRTVIIRDDFSFVGMLQFAALGLGAVLPPALLMLVAHIHRWAASEWKFKLPGYPTALTVALGCAVRGRSFCQLGSRAGG